jgi:hypothetical protein
MKKAAPYLMAAGLLLAVTDYIVTNAQNPPGALGTAITNIDDLNGALTGLAPYIGVGTLVFSGGLLAYFL